MSEAFDCIVLGGGPAGSTVATLVAVAGYRTLLLEREKMPRFHIGESLMPETYWTLKRLGVLERMKSSHFPKKYSVQFVNHRGKESAPFYFHETDKHESSQTWQVLRSEFDHMLFENAAEKGASCVDGSRVVDVLFDGSRAVGVDVQTDGQPTRRFSGSVVVDATGQQSVIATRLGLRRPNERLRKASIWTYYRGAVRDAGIDEGATVILHTQSRRCWFWYIPLPDDTVSVGVVGDVDTLLRGHGSPEAVFHEQLAACPALLERVQSAAVAGPYRVTRDFSYLAERPSGDGWVLVGDAYGFLDPVYSSGVFLALKSGEMAADCIVEGLTGGDTSAAQLGKWAPKFAQGMDLIRKLVFAFYTDEFSFGKFIRQYPHHKDRLTDLLVGKVFKAGTADLFRDMDPWLRRAQGDPASPPSPEMTV